MRATGPTTSLGRSVVLVGLSAWLVGIWFGWRELQVMAAGCILAVAIAVLFTIGRIELRVAAKVRPPRVVAGDRAVVELDVSNALTRRMLPVRLEVPIGPAIAVVDVPTLAGGDTFEETIVIPTLRRSVITIGPTRSVRGDPLGLMRREIAWAEAETLYVHPVTCRLSGVASGWLRDLEGRPTNDRSPSDVAFHTLREYVPGDDRRHVHWRTSARIGKLMVRQFIDNRRSHLGIVIDTNPGSYADADEFELAVSMAASLGLRALTDGQELSCVAGAHGVDANTGQALLDGLAAVELGAPTIDMQETALRASRLVGGASVIAIATGSALALPALQLAAQRLSTESQVVALRADASAESGMMRAANLLALTANSLDGFTRVMWAVSNS